ncbi:hypothetical protein COL88_27580 [Bacillus thuringiensis]|nr:hypothetical protein CN522_28700 [Bacillus cereus]PFH64891.1 hypothetical protein COI62_25520 [Bacillus cereus]PFR37155.1 hypothetical protein COK20_15820 [Bacillus cereus]PFW24363.1 hypothetical protein COL07_24240 [Bacillus cereus]PGA44379.1 hypothetical protein COL88_27580 [Bacillus thuringiensis]
MLYICFGMSAIFSLIKEFRKQQINQFLILVDSLILLRASFLVVVSSSPFNKCFSSWQLSSNKSHPLVGLTIFL